MIIAGKETVRLRKVGVVNKKINNVGDYSATENGRMNKEVLKGKGEESKGL